MPQTSDKTTGGNQILRYAQLETMLEGSSALRENLANNISNGNDFIPSRVDPNHFAQTGFVRERNTELEQQSKEELINMLLKNTQNFNNNVSQNQTSFGNNTDFQQLIFQSKLHLIYYKLAQIN